MQFVYNDGGRAIAGFKGKSGDCVTRAIAIALQLPYLDVYQKLNDCAKTERTGKRKKTLSNARTGVYKQTVRKFMESRGWKWTPTMQIGSGCTVHLTPEELPKEQWLVVSVSRHLIAVKDGIIYDTFADLRNGKRCVYGYYSNKDTM